MSRRRRKRKSGNVWIVISLIVIIISAIVITAGLAYSYGRKQLAKTISDKMVEEAIKETARQSGINREELNAVLESVDEDDKEQIYNIVEKHLDKETVKKGIECAKDGDFTMLEEYAHEKLTEEEYDTLMGLYEKYKDEIEGK